jgi:hypothetical protein
VFVKVKLWAELVVATFSLEKVSEVDERVAAEAVPVPDKLIDCGELGALSVILIEAERPKIAVGVNVTVIAQEPPLAVTVPPHVFVSAKSPVLDPDNEILERVRFTFPVLVSVTVCEELVVPTVWGEKLRLDDDKLTIGLVPVPVKLTLC